MVHWHLSIHSSSFTCLYRIYYSLCSTGGSSNSSLRDSWDGAAADLVYGTSQMSKEQLAQLYPTIIPIAVVKYLYPSGATLYTFMTAWASFTLLGMILYFVSLISKNILWGLAVSGIIVFLDPILMWLAWPKKLLAAIFFSCLLDKRGVTRFCTGASGTHDSSSFSSVCNFAVSIFCGNLLSE